jgi:hypothetical protein
MGKPNPIVLRERVVAFVEEGCGHREAAWYFRASPRLVNNILVLNPLQSCSALGQLNDKRLRLFGHGNPPSGRAMT